MSYDVLTNLTQLIVEFRPFKLSLSIWYEFSKHKVIPKYPTMNGL